MITCTNGKSKLSYRNYQEENKCSTWTITTTCICWRENVEVLLKLSKIYSLTSEIQERELDQILQEMAQTVLEYEEQLDYSTVGISENTGKPIEEVGQRQARRQILTFTTFTKKAPRFAESLGLIPETLCL